MTIFRSMLLVLSFILYMQPVSAQIYKSTDANGRVVFSDAPPSGNTQEVIMKTLPTQSVEVPPIDWAAKNRELRLRMQTNERQQQMQAKSGGMPPPTFADMRLQVGCSNAKYQQKELNRVEGQRAYWRGSPSEKIYLSDDDRAKIKENVQRSFDKNCK